jgi:hypothetical protein
MKILQIIPKAGINSKLKTLLKTTERQLRGPHTTFERIEEGRWKHVKYPGWILSMGASKPVLPHFR